MHHLAELLPRDALFLLTLLLDKTRLLHYIAGAEKQHTLAGQSVTARASRFLIITFDVLRQIVMDDKTDIRLVDPHSERDRGCDHARVVAKKLFLVSCPFLRFQARVIWLRFDSIVVQFCR